MRTVVLVHWNADEANERAQRLRGAEYAVAFFRSDSGPAALREVREVPPDAFVVDLSRLPSHGRAVAVALRQQKQTRFVPLVFVEGSAAKVAPIRSQIPDACFTTWSKIRGVLRKAIERPPSTPVVPKTMDAYSGTPLPKKLGIKPGFTVALLDAPEEFESRLGEVPPDVRIRRDMRSAADLILLFASSQKDLLRRLPQAQRAMNDGGSIWIAWPKKSSGLLSNLSDRWVRETGLSRGLVDYKVCAIDDTWSGLRFARRK